MDPMKPLLWVIAFVFLAIPIAYALPTNVPANGGVQTTTAQTFLGDASTFASP